MERRALLLGGIATGVLAIGLLGAGMRAPVADAAGCNEVVLPASIVPGSAPASLLTRVQGNFTVTGIFRYNNTTKKYDALYFSAPGAPVDAGSVNPGDSVFICGTGSGSFVIAP